MVVKSIDFQIPASTYQTFISYHLFPPLVPECDPFWVEPVWVKRNEVFLQLYQ